MDKIIITIDGVAGSGKSSAAQSLSRKIKSGYLDTGAMYRAITWGILVAKIDVINDDISETALKNWLENLDIKIYMQNNASNTIILEKQPLALELRSSVVNEMVSTVAASPIIRDYLVQLQRDIVQESEFNLIIAEGRDMGTVVFPQAQRKYFFVADAQVRAKRRLMQNQVLGLSTNLEEILSNIIVRDNKDVNRFVSPTNPASNAKIIDTSIGSLEEIVDKLYCDLCENGILKEKL